MIDRSKRDIAAVVLRQFLDGHITNDDFIGQFPVDKNDPALNAIRYCVWLQISDFRRHTLTGKYVPKPDLKALLERCSLFLRSDHEFQWPNPYPGILAVLLSLMTLGLVARLYGRKYRRLGAFDVWPFLTKSEYEAELSRQALGPPPRSLKGGDFG